MLSDLMERHGLTRYSLAQQAGVSTRAVGKWLAGDTPSMTSAVKLARAFGVADGETLLNHWGYEAVDLEALEQTAVDSLDVQLLILDELRAQTLLLRRLDGLLRHANREQGEQPNE